MKQAILFLCLALTSRTPQATASIMTSDGYSTSGSVTSTFKPQSTNNRLFGSTGEINAEKHQVSTNYSSTPLALYRYTENTAGDLDKNGILTLSEIQHSINMLLGTKRIESCVDQDGNGTVTIPEVKKVINRFLQL